MVCVLTPGAGAEPRKQVRQYQTTTAQLRQLSAWLQQCGVTHAAMEATGVYWKPVFNVLEPACELILVNARQVRHGLLQASFVPPRAVRELRDLCRMRASLVRECVQIGNRLRKVLEDANIKLDSVASDALGISGRDMIRALIEGEQDPAALAQLARGRLRSKKAALEEALEGQVREHHRFLMGQWMKLLRALEEQVAEVAREIERRMEGFAWAAELLMSVPGVDRTAACALIGEIGADMSRFPSSRHLASWAGLCPGNRQSAGHNRSGRSHRGNPWIKALAVQIAWAASRSKNTYCAALYRRLAPHRGKKRALIAVANSLLQAVWFILTRRQSYRDLGGDYFEQLHRERTTQSLVRRLERIGYRVALEPA